MSTQEPSDFILYHNLDQKIVKTIKICSRFEATAIIIWSTNISSVIS